MSLGTKRGAEMTGTSRPGSGKANGAGERRLDGAVLEGVLAVVDGPALVCDAGGRVRVWNDAFADRASTDPPVDGAAVERFLAWDGDDPLARALDGEAATASACLSDDGRQYSVTARPLADGAGAVVTLAEPDVDWSVYESALDASPDDVYVFDGDARIRAISDGCGGTGTETGTTPAEALVGGRIDRLAEHSVLTARMVQECRDALQAVLAGRRDAVAVTPERPVEHGRAVEVTVAPVRREGVVVGASVTVRDVTDREERQRELAATNERLDMALANTGAGVHEWYVDEDCVYWHETTSRLFGLDPGTTTRAPADFSDRVHPEDRGDVVAAVEEAMETDGHLSVEYRVNDPGEEPRWVVSEGEFEYEDGEPTWMVGTVRDVTDRKRREQELEERERRLRAVIESSADPIAMQDTDGYYRVVNRAFVDVAGCSRSRVRGATPGDVFGGETARHLERHRQGVLERERARVAEEQILGGGETDRVVQLTVAPHYDHDGNVGGTVTIARDITELQRHREELETLTAIQELVQESVRSATSASTREAVKRTVCDRLADSPFYEGVWVGSRAGSAREITPDYAAGNLSEYLEEISVTVDTSERGLGPAGTAYRTGDVQVVADVREDPDFEPWREAALEHGLESLAVVPLTHGSTTHGILALYTDRPDPFSDRERDGFETLGAAVGFALSAAQQRRLLEADCVLELEYAVEADRSPLVQASVEHDCRFVLSGPVHTRDGEVLNYLTVEGADPTVGVAAVHEDDRLTSIRRLEGDGPHLEVKWRESVFQYLTEAGARGVRGVIDGGVDRLYVEAPGDTDVRRVTEAVRRWFDGVTLVAKRERDRSDSPWWHAYGDPGTQLTDRQRGVLQAAYYSGYYEWPRETDAETLADSLEVATSTLLQHLRKGHRRILESMFDS
jgi:PAS domain S-box-containing protein